MKHRSLVIFVIIVAALAVVPEAAQQLAEFKRTAAERAVRGVSNAFLNLYAERLRGRETRPEAIVPTPDTPEAATTRMQACSLPKTSDAALADARRASETREKARAGRPSSDMPRTHANAGADEVLLAKNEFVRLDAGGEVHVVKGLTPELAARVQVALEDREQLAAVGKDLNVSELGRVFQRVESPHAAPSPAPEFPRFEKDFARHLARQAERSVREGERRRAAHLKQLEKANNAHEAGNGNFPQHGKGRRVKVHVSPTPPAPGGDAPSPATAPAVETIIGF